MDSRGFERLCGEPGCDGEHVAKGFCQNHYNAYAHKRRMNQVDADRMVRNQDKRYRKFKAGTPGAIEQLMLDGEIDYDEFERQLDAAGWMMDFDSGEFVPNVGLSDADMTALLGLRTYRVTQKYVLEMLYAEGGTAFIVDLRDKLVAHFNAPKGDHRYLHQRITTALQQLVAAGQVDKLGPGCYVLALDVHF